LLHYVNLLSIGVIKCLALQRVAVCCSVLQMLHSVADFDLLSVGVIKSLAIGLFVACACFCIDACVRVCTARACVGVRACVREREGRRENEHARAHVCRKEMVCAIVNVGVCVCEREQR